METLDTSSISWLGLGTLALLVIWLYFEKKRHPNLEPGKIIMLYLTKYNISVFMGLCIIMNLAEAMMAASLISGKEQFALSYLARYLGHLSLSAMSVLGALTIFKEVKIWRSTFTGGFKGFSLWKLFVRSARIVISAGAAFLLPMINMFIIASGLGETAHLKILLASFYFWDFDGSSYMYQLAKNGYTIDFEPWDVLSYPMVATVAVTISHMIAIVWEGLTMTDIDDPVFIDAFKIHQAPAPASAPNGNPAPNAGGTPPTPAPNPSAPSPQNPYEEAMVDILKFYGLDDNQVKGRLDQARNALNSQDDATRIAIGSLFAGLQRELQSFTEAVQNGSLTGQAKADRETQIKKKISDTFAGSIRNKKGLGISLPRVTPAPGN